MEKNAAIVAIGQCKSQKKEAFEYGDFFHLAAALIMRPSLEYVFVGNLKNAFHAKLFNFITKFKKPKKVISFDAYQKEIKKHKKYQGVTQTAGIFVKNKRNKSEVQKKFAEIIEDNISEDEKKQSFVFLESLSFLKKSQKKKCFLWLRNEEYKPNRNITPKGVLQLKKRLSAKGYDPILIGSSIDVFVSEKNNLIGFHKRDIFQRGSVFFQLFFLKKLIEKYDIEFSVGMKSGGMDVPAFVFGLPTYYFSTRDNNERMDKTSSVFLNFKKIEISGDEEMKFKLFTDKELDELDGRISLDSRA